jgi:uncharacterized membrane protein YfcA
LTTYTESQETVVPADAATLLAAIFIGAALQVGVGIVFSIVVAPLMMVLLGTSVAVPVLLLLNTMVSAIATERKMWAAERLTIKRAVIGCLIGVAAGLTVYPLLSEQTVLLLTASLLLLGVLTTLIPLKRSLSEKEFSVVSVSTGLATVWAATPGPLMVFGLMASGHTAHSVRKLVQPVALIAYGVAFALHCVTNWDSIAQAPGLVQFTAATLLGSVVGRALGSKLSPRLITHAIRTISVLACVALFRRAWMID